jgi:hypothetical protein
VRTGEECFSQNVEKIVIELLVVQSLLAKAFCQTQMMIKLTTNYRDSYKKYFEKNLFIFFLFVFGIEVAL